MCKAVQRKQALQVARLTQLSGVTAILNGRIAGEKRDY